MTSLYVPVRIGDLIEFSGIHNGEGSASTHQGRVMDVDPDRSHECTLQVSPYAPFVTLDLTQSIYKVIYGAGEFSETTNEMIGWEVEFPNESSSAGGTDHAVVKQVDCDMNCVLVAFDDGRKDWRDLTMNAFKVLGRPTRISSPKRPVEAVVGHPVQHETMEAREGEVPVPDFDWYSEGGHVELCDDHGQFEEGALFCARKDGTLHLFNEKRQFFDITLIIQSFKVVIHGLLHLKSIPMGQSVDIYSPMHGEFRNGMVMKTAELGKLTPVRFPDVGIEWLDLSSQTFKLVFLRSQLKFMKHSNVSENAVDGVKLAPLSEPRHRRLESNFSEDHEIQHSRSHRPALRVGQQLELFDSTSRQYLKYRIAAIDAEKSHHYHLEQMHGSKALLAVTDMAKALVMDLEHTKCRILLTSSDWKEWGYGLVGQRVDVYDKHDRTVLGGKIVEMDDSDHGRLHIKLKDGSKRWFELSSTKVKLKMSRETKNRQPDPELPDQSKTSTEESFRERRATVGIASPERTNESVRNLQLTRQASEKLPIQETSALPRTVSSPVMGSRFDGPTRLPTLDFSRLRPPAPENIVEKEATDSQRSRTPNGGEQLSELLPPMDDIWTEESANDGSGPRYVHIGTGEIRNELPRWLKKLGEATNESFILNTATGTQFQLPGFTQSTPQTSARVVALPIGPLEAVRVVSQITNDRTETQSTENIHEHENKQDVGDS
ncbi:hypothetical protein Poli38472_002985 [Pythium oligandrum]|uniref:Uncharacterized protein n=1 Tax=Pythium oligandrum TaxID=41045 RepID=A0A8K1FBA3_PYTOL|nr:hypothetical protein Poli38472_002985 [Pythium oligandrum]|eukprot:TMW57060.1 hypothetical protein Poli38472_002985 [Pythium oligandrum]